MRLLSRLPDVTETVTFIISTITIGTTSTITTTSGTITAGGCRTNNTAVIIVITAATGRPLESTTGNESDGLGSLVMRYPWFLRRQPVTTLIVSRSLVVLQAGRRRRDRRRRTRVDGIGRMSAACEHEIQ